jgi:hypothetical protein
MQYLITVKVNWRYHIKLDEQCNSHWEGGDKCPFKAKKRKMIIIGGSHVGGCTKELSKYLGKDLEFNGIVMLGSRIDNVTHLSDKEINTLNKDDAVLYEEVQMMLIKMKQLLDSSSL